MWLINKYLLIYHTSCAEYEQANHGCQTVTHEIDILQEQCEGTDIVVIDCHFINDHQSQLYLDSIFNVEVTTCLGLYTRYHQAKAKKYVLQTALL